MNPREEFHKKTGDFITECYANNTEKYNPNYISWLEKKLEQAESFDKNIIEIVWQAVDYFVKFKDSPATQDEVELWIRLFQKKHPELFIHKAEKPIDLNDLKERFKEWFTYDPSLATYSQVFFFLNEQPEFKKGE
jgi:sulfur relay (sulfurtransferase) DsrC/TusE family protein